MRRTLDLYVAMIRFVQVNWIAYKHVIDFKYRVEALW